MRGRQIVIELERRFVGVRADPAAAPRRSCWADSRPARTGPESSARRDRGAGGNEAAGKRRVGLRIARLDRRLREVAGPLERPSARRRCCGNRSPPAAARNSWRRRTSCPCEIGPPTAAPYWFRSSGSLAAVPPGGAHRLAFSVSLRKNSKAAPRNWFVPDFVTTSTTPAG